jgi:hypothetical protein
MIHLGDIGYHLAAVTNYVFVYYIGRRGKEDGGVSGRHCRDIIIIAPVFACCISVRLFFFRLASRTGFLCNNNQFFWNSRIATFGRAARANQAFPA